MASQSDNHNDPDKRVKHSSDYEKKLRDLQIKRTKSEQERRQDRRAFSLEGLRVATVLNQLQALQAVQGMQELLPKDEAAHRRYEVPEDSQERSQRRLWLMFKADWLEALLESTVHELEVLNDYEREHSNAPEDKNE